MSVSGLHISKTETTAASAISRDSWLILLYMAVLITAVAFLYAPTIVSLQVEWLDTDSLTYTHGYLICGICAWLLLRARAQFVGIQPRMDVRGVPLLLLLSLLWLVSYRSGIQLGHQVLLPLLVWVSVFAAMGWPIARRSAFAFGYIYLAVPIWSVGNPILQDLTVAAVRVLLKLSGVAAHVQGNLVNIAAGSFEVAGGCSGLHFFIVALAIAALYGEVNRDSLRVRAAVFALAAALAMISNWLRVYTIIIAGHLTDMQHYLVRVDHYYFGWAVFAVTMVAFFAIVRRIPVEEMQADRVTPETQIPAPRMSLALAVILGAIVIAPVWNWMMPVASAAPSSRELMPALARSWTGPFAAHDRWRPQFPRCDRCEQVSYRRDDKVVDVFTAEYLSQHQGKELIGFDNDIAGTMRGNVVSEAQVSSGDEKRMEMQLTDAKGRGALVRYEYRIAQQRTIKPLAAQLLYGIESLVSHPVSRVIAVHAACESDCEAARALLDEFFVEFDEGLARQNRSAKE